MKTILSALLSFLCAFTLFQYFKPARPTHPPAAIIAQLPKPLPARHVARDEQETAPLYASARTYTYVFTGLATYQGQPCPGASVEILTFSRYGSYVHRVITGPDGLYTKAVPVVGEPDETLSWEIHALTPDLQKADLEGRQILLSEPTVQLDEPLTFAES